jgi:hypothetical protein
MARFDGKGLGPFGLPSAAELIGGWWLLGIVSAGILASNAWQPLCELTIPLQAYLMGDWIAWLDRKLHGGNQGSGRTQVLINLLVGIIVGMWLLCVGIALVLLCFTGKGPL